MAPMVTATPGVASAGIWRANDSGSRTEMARATAGAKGLLTDRFELIAILKW